MKIHSFQHVPFEGLAQIEPWTKSRKYSLKRTHFFSNDALPALNAFDALIVMGGPMSVHDEHEFPWLKAEKQFIEKAIQAGKKVLGICLGAQLIAHVLGVKVTRNRHKEIGWFPVQKTQEAEKSAIFKALPSAFQAFHWHGETFEIPRSAIHTLKSEACPHQAFVYQSSVVGLQFHLETTLQSAQALITHCQNELVEAPFIQKASEILSDSHRFKTIHSLLDSFLDSWMSCGAER